MKTLNSVLEFLRRRKTILMILLIIIVIGLTKSIYAWWPKSGNELILNPGIIRTTGVEVYGGNLTICNSEECLNWGVIYPGTATNRSFYLTSKWNIGRTLIMKCGNWTFQDSNNQPVNVSFSNAMNISCSQNHTIIQPNDPIYVTLSLKLGSSPQFIDTIITNDVQTFNFDTHIYTKDNTSH